MNNEDFLKYVKVYKPKEYLVKEGDQDHDFFCLLQGKVGIWRGNLDEPDQMVKIGELTEKGTYFGEMGQLLQEQRTASIIASNENSVKVLKFPGEMLDQMILKQPKLGLKVCAALANRLKGTTDKQQEVAIERNEIRDDATSQFLHAKEQYQKVFVMLTSIQKQLQHPNIKSCIEFMTHDKLLQGGRKIHINEEFLADIPDTLKEHIKKAYADTLI